MGEQGLSELVPVEEQFLAKLDYGIREARRREGRRGHMGFSQIGGDDDRLIWLRFRWCLPDNYPASLLRTFGVGNATERLQADWLRHIPGVQLHTADGEGRQFRFHLLGGHLSGTMDGAVVGLPGMESIWCVWEAKSANSSRFNALKKLSNGDHVQLSWEELRRTGLREWNPEYWGQVIGYMGLTGMQKALVTVLDKNSSEVLVFFVDADPMEYQMLIGKAERLIESPTPPPPMYPRPTDWRVKIKLTDELDRAVYFKERLPPTSNCRNCRFSKPLTNVDGAQWHCQLRNIGCGNRSHQEAGCDKHQFIPELMPARALKEGHPADHSPMEYITPEGAKFANGEGEFSSDELIELSKSEFALISDPIFNRMRKTMNSKVLLTPDGEIDWDANIPF